MRAGRGGRASSPHSEVLRWVPRWKTKGVDAGSDQEEYLDTENHVVVVAERLGVEEEEAGGRHDDESQVSPWQHAPRECLNGHLPKGDTQKTKVHHHRCADEQTQGEDVCRLDEGPHVQRLQERDAPRSLPQPAQEAFDHGTGARGSEAPVPGEPVTAESGRSLGRTVSVA